MKKVKQPYFISIIKEDGTEILKRYCSDDTERRINTDIYKEIVKESGGRIKIIKTNEIEKYELPD